MNYRERGRATRLIKRGSQSLCLCESSVPPRLHFNIHNFFRNGISQFGVNYSENFPSIHDSRFTTYDSRGAQ